MGYADLGGHRTIVVPIYNSTREEYDQRRQTLLRSIYDSAMKGRARGSPPPTFEIWRSKNLTATSGYRLWQFNEISGVIELFRDGHRIKVVLYDRLSERGKPAPRTGAFKRVGRIAETDICSNREGALREAVVRAIDQVVKQLPKRFVDVNMNLIDNLDLERFFSHRLSLRDP